MSKILLINDLAEVGKVACSAMIPVLSSMGHDVSTCLSAVVSNTLDYGVFDILDTTDHMEKTFACWKKLGFSFDCICTGFIVGDKQPHLIQDYIKSFDSKPLVIVDPIMGDDGQLYPGLSENVVDNMRMMIQNADVIVPNFTEAAFLSGQCQAQTHVSQKELRAITAKLRAYGAKSIVVTSCVSTENECFVWGYDDQTQEDFALPYTLIPVRFPGTGDIFCSVLSACLLAGKSLKDSCQTAMDTVVSLIQLNCGKEDKFAGLDLEASLLKINR